MFLVVACNVSSVAEEPARDWQRVARYVQARRTRLGIKQTASKVSPATWTKIENAKQTSYKPFMLAAIEVELDWPSGTILDIAEGGVPPEEATEMRLTQIEDELLRQADELRRQADAIAKIERLLRSLQPSD